MFTQPFPALVSKVYARPRTNRLKSTLRRSLGEGMGVALLLLTIATSALGQSPDTPAAKPERWLGTLDAGGMELRLYFEWQAPSESQEFRGHMVSLDQGAAEIPIQQVTQDGSKRKIEVPAVGGVFEGELSADGRRIEGTWSQSGRSLPLVLYVAEGLPKDELLEAWKGILEAGPQKLELQLRILRSAGQTLARFDSLNQRALGLSAVLLDSKGALKFEVPVIQGRFEGTLNATGDEADGHWHQGGMKLALKLTKTQQATDKLPEVKRPQTPREPFPYAQHSVSIEHSEANIVLSGTLTVPEGEGPFPAVVLVSGSGPQDRDEALLGHRPFWVLADYLSRHGVAVLRYDDRGVGKSTGEFHQATTRDFAADAEAAIQFLRAQAGIDPDRIGVVGHSEGGLVAGMLAARVPSLAHVVLLAGPGVPGDKIIDSQTKAILEGMGVSPETVDAQLKTTMEIVELIRQGTDEEQVNDRIRQLVERPEQLDLESEQARRQAQQAQQTVYEQLNSPWFRFFVQYDPVSDLRKTRCPVLAVFGEKDQQVLPAINVPRMEATLRESSIGGHRCVVLPGLNHLFQTAPTGSPTEYETIEETLSPELLKLVTEWVAEH